MREKEERGKALFKGVIVAAGGAAGKARSGRTTRIAPPRTALQAPASLIEDLEEQCGGTIVLKLDGEGPFWTAGAGDLAPSSGHEDFAWGTTSTFAPMARQKHPVCCSHSSGGPLGDISSAKNRGSWIHVRSGITAHTTNSREEPLAWVRGPAAHATSA